MLRKRHMLTRGHRSDRGNIIVAVMIIVVLVTISSALLYRVVGDARLVVAQQNTSIATAAADAAVADAMFRIDQGQVGADPRTPAVFCVKAGDANCVASSITGAPGISYVARQTTIDHGRKWTIDALATSGTRTGAVQQTETKNQEFPFAIFSHYLTDINGTSGGCCDVYNSSTSTTFNNTDPIYFGTDHSIVCSGGTGSNVYLEYYDGSTPNCGAGGANTTATTSSYPFPSTNPPSQNSGCPWAPGGTGNGVISAATTIGPGTNGPYVCTTLTIGPNNTAVNVTLSGPVVIYLNPTSPGTDLTIGGGSYVNDPWDAKSCTAISATCQLPVASNLVIYDNAPYTSDTTPLYGDGNSNGNGGYFFGGVIYGPNAGMTGDGCKSTYYGSVNLDDITCNGGPHFQVHYDEGLSTVTSSWTAGQYTVLNPNQVSIP